MAAYTTIQQLAEMLERAAKDGRHPRLTPRTAGMLAIAVKAFATRPTPDVALQIFCGRSCSAVCYQCRGKANVVCRLFEGCKSPFEG